MTTQKQQFIINALLIDPISKIISQIQNGEMRDCDIKWMDSKLEKYISFSAETLGLKIILGGYINKKFENMNEYVKEYYESKFNTLLNYFKSF